MKCDKRDLLLYAVTDRSWSEGTTLGAQVEEALRGGATFVQLREKKLTGEALRAEALEIQAVCRRYGVPFVINDDVALAKEIDADGVHVGQDDMEAGDVRAILGADKIIGVSAHNVEEALRAERHGADYLGVGAAFTTSSKPEAGHIDAETIRAICETVKIPVIAIGGIKEENLLQLRGNGLCGVAVISAIFAQKDIDVYLDIYASDNYTAQNGELGNLPLPKRRYGEPETIKGLNMDLDCFEDIFAKYPNVKGVRFHELIGTHDRRNDGHGFAIEFSLLPEIAQMLKDHERRLVWGDQSWDLCYTDAAGHGFWLDHLNEVCDILGSDLTINFNNNGWGAEIQALEDAGLSGGFMAWNAMCSLSKLEDLKPAFDALTK